jgi:hypothetical protein
MTVTKASAIPREQTAWRWRDYLARGTFHTVTGRQSHGKSTVAAYIVARLSTGEALPNDTARKPIRCGYLTVEESESRVVDRLEAADADLENVHILPGRIEWQGEPELWQLPTHIVLLENAIQQHGLKFLFIDGLGYVVEGRQDFGDTGKALLRLSDVADATGCTILGSTHVSKGEHFDPLSTAIGSQAWSTVPRTILAVAFDPDDMATPENERRRSLRLVKTNYTPLDYGVTFEIATDPDIEVGYVTNVAKSYHSTYTFVETSNIPHPPHAFEWVHGHWERKSKDKAPDAEQRAGEAVALRAAQVEIIRGIFERNGPITATDLEDEAKQHGVVRYMTRKIRDEIALPSSQARDPKTGKLGGPGLWYLKEPFAVAPTATTASADGLTGSTSGTTNGQKPRSEPLNRPPYIYTNLGDQGERANDGADQGEQIEEKVTA